jgi:hypothetical protein
MSRAFSQQIQSRYLEMESVLQNLFTLFLLSTHQELLLNRHLSKVAFSA